MASVFFGGKFFQSLNKSLVQVLIKQLGAHILKYIHADFEKAAVGGLMDHVSLDHVSLNVHQINSDLILHQIPFQVAYGTIKKLEINLYLAHAQLHIIVTGLRIGISPHYSSSLLFSLDNYFYDESHLTSQGGRKGVGGGGSAARTTAGAGPSSEQEHSSSSSSSSAPGAPPGAGGFGPSGGGGSGLVPSSYSGGISNFISSSLTSSILGGGGGAGAGQKGKGFFSGALGSFGGGGAGGGGSGGSTSGSSSSSGASPHGVDASQNVNRDSILLLLPREVYDSQVGKIKSHVKTCENRLRRESLRKQIERVDRLIQHLQQQLADRAPGASTAEALRSAIERHKAEALALQEQMKDSVLTDGDSNEFQPLLQWFVRYMPNIKIRIDDVRIDFEDLKDTVHPMRCGLKVSRILLQPQPQGLWQVNWPKRQDDETNADDSSTTTRTNVSNSSSRDRQTTSAASADHTSSDVSVGLFLDGGFQGTAEDSGGSLSSDGSPRCGDTSCFFASTDTPTPDSTGGSSPSSSSSTSSSARDLTYAISLEGFGVFWEDTATVIGSAAPRGVGTSAPRSRLSPRNSSLSSRRAPPSSSSTFSSASLVRSPTELAEVLSSSSASSGRTPPPRPAVHTSAGGVGSRASDLVAKDATTSPTSSSSLSSRQQHRSDPRDGGGRYQSSSSSSAPYPGEDLSGGQGGEDSDAASRVSSPSTASSASSPVLSERIATTSTTSSSTATFSREHIRRRRGEVGAGEEEEEELTRNTIFFRRWLLRPCDVQLHCGLHSSSGLLPPATPTVVPSSSYVSGVPPPLPMPLKQMVTKFVLRLERSVEVEIDEGMMMGCAMIYKRLEHQKRLSLLRVYRPNVRPRCMYRWHPQPPPSKSEGGHQDDDATVSTTSSSSLPASSSSSVTNSPNVYTYHSGLGGRAGPGGEKEVAFYYKEPRWGEGDSSFPNLHKRGKSSCKQWWFYALQFVRLVRQQRPVAASSSDHHATPAGDRAGGGGGGSRSNYWGQMEERTSHMKRYLRIAKRFLLEQRLERILNGPVISSSSLPDFAKTSERGTSSPASLSTHPSSASSASTSSPSGFFEVSQSSSSSSSYFFGRSPAARLSPADLQDFFSHYWHEYQQQLLLVRQHQHHRNHGRGPGHPAALPSTSSGSAQSGRAGVGRAGGGGAGGGYYYLAGDLDRDDDGGATPAGGVGGVHDSDAAFVVKETASRPYWAIAQWHMLACEEISRAENHLQQLPHIREQQKELRQSILQLEQEQMSLLATRQKLLLTTRLHTPGRHESHPGDAKEVLSHLQHQEQEQLQAVQLSQQKVQELLQPYHKEVLSWFENSSQFVRLARRAIACLEALRHRRLRSDQEDDEEHPGVTVEEYTRVTRLLKASSCWRRSRDRMLCWADFYRKYSVAFPLTECVLVDLPQLERLSHQQQDAVLSLAESSGLVVKRATRQTTAGGGGGGGSAGSLGNVDSYSRRGVGPGALGSSSVDGTTQSSPASHTATSPSVALPPVPEICRHITEARPLPIPRLFRHVLFACVLRHVSVRVSPRVAASSSSSAHRANSSSSSSSSTGTRSVASRSNNEKATRFPETSPSSSKYYSLHQRQADLQLQLQWIGLDIKDIAFQLQTYEELSLTACLRTCELLHLRGSRTPSTTNSSSSTTSTTSSGPLAKENVLIVTAGRLVERSKQVILRLAHTSSAPPQASPKPSTLTSSSEGDRDRGSDRGEGSISSSSSSSSSSAGSSPGARSYSSSPRGGGGGGGGSSRRGSTGNRLHPDQSLHVASSLFLPNAPASSAATGPAGGFPGSSPPLLSHGGRGAEREKTSWGTEGQSSQRISLENDLFNDVILLHVKDEEEPPVSSLPGGGGGQGGPTPWFFSSALSHVPPGSPGRSVTSRRSSGASSVNSSGSGLSGKSAAEGGGRGTACLEDRTGGPSSFRSSGGGAFDVGGGRGGPIDASGGAVIDEGVKKVMQKAVAKARRMQHTFSRKWVWGTVQMFSTPLFQNQLRLGLPLYVHVVLYGQRIHVSASIQQLQMAYEDTWRLFTSFLYTTLACDRELGVRPRSINSADCLAFYSGLLSQYRAYNQEVAGGARAGGGGRGGDSTQLSSAPGVSTPQVPAVVAKGFKSFAPPPVDLQFLIDRVVSSVSSMQSPPVGLAPGLSSSGGAPSSPTLVSIPTDTPQSVAVPEATLLQPLFNTENSAALQTDHSRVTPLHSSASSPSLIEARRKAGISVGGLPVPPASGEGIHEPGGDAGLHRAGFRRSSEGHTNVGAGKSSGRVTSEEMEDSQHHSFSSSSRKFAQHMESEHLLTGDWRRVATALSYTCLHGKIQLPSIDVQLYDKPNFVPVQPPPYMNNPLGHPGTPTLTAVQGGGGGSAGDKVASASHNNSRTPSKEKRSQLIGDSPPVTMSHVLTNPTSNRTGGELTSCIVSLTSIGGGVQAVALPFVPVVKPRNEAETPITPGPTPICTFTLASPYTLTVSLGETKSPDGSPRLYVSLPPAILVKTSSALSLLSVIPVLTELIREKVSLFRLLSAVFQPDCFDFTPFDLVRLLRSQIVLSGCCKGVGGGGEQRYGGDDSVSAFSRGLTLSSPVEASGAAVTSSDLFSSSGDGSAGKCHSSVKGEGIFTSQSREDSMASVLSDESGRSVRSAQPSGSVYQQGSLGLRRLPSAGGSGTSSSKGHEDDFLSFGTEQNTKESWWLRILESSLAPRSQSFGLDDSSGASFQVGVVDGISPEAGSEGGESSTWIVQKRSDSFEGDPGGRSGASGKQNQNFPLDRGEEQKTAVVGRSHLSLPVQQKHVDDDGNMSESLWCPSGDEDDDGGAEPKVSQVVHGGPEAERTEVPGPPQICRETQQEFRRDSDEKTGRDMRETILQGNLSDDKGQTEQLKGMLGSGCSQGDSLGEDSAKRKGIGGIGNDHASLADVVSMGDTVVLTGTNFFDEQQSVGDSVYSQVASGVPPSPGNLGSVHHHSVSPGDSVQISSVSSVVSEGTGVPTSIDSTSTRPPSSTEKAIESGERRHLEKVVSSSGSPDSLASQPLAVDREQPSTIVAPGLTEPYCGSSGVCAPPLAVPGVSASAGDDSSVFLVAKSVPLSTAVGGADDGLKESQSPLKISEQAVALGVYPATSKDGSLTETTARGGVPSFSARVPPSDSVVLTGERLGTGSLPGGNDILASSGLPKDTRRDGEAASEASSKKGSQRTSRRESSGEEGGNRSDHSAGSGGPSSSSHLTSVPFSSSSSSGARLGNLLSRMGRRKGGGTGRSRGPSPLAAAVEESALAQQKPEEQEEVREIRGVKGSGKRSHPFKLFNG